jgi:hypothetical protein
MGTEPSSRPVFLQQRISSHPYSPECVEGVFSEVRNTKQRQKYATWHTRLPLEHLILAYVLCNLAGLTSRPALHTRPYYDPS